MKILITSKCPTHPTTAGNRWWILSQVNYLKRLGHEVHFLYINEVPFRTMVQEAHRSLLETKEYWGINYHQYDVPILQKICRVISSKFQDIFCNSYYNIDEIYPWGLHKYVNELDSKHSFDVCIINYAYLSKLFLKISIPIKGLATHDALAYRDKVVGYQIPTITASQEAKAIQRCPHVFALQDVEAHYFQLLSPRSHIYKVYGQFNYCPQAIVGNRKLLFLSGNNIFNQHGINWFLETIFPEVCSKISGVELIIGGSICNTLKNTNLPSNVKLLGFIGSPAEFYSLGDIAINPVSEGTGLKIKTFEAVAFDKVAIVHPHSMNGIYVNKDVPVLAATSTEEWVSYLSLLWSNVSEIRRIKDCNRRYITEMNTYIDFEYNRFLTSKP